jgi:hypothetical protein
VVKRRVSETPGNITCLVHAESSTEVSAVRSEPPAELSLTVLLIFIKQAEMGGGGWRGAETGVNMGHTRSNIINMAKMIMHMAAPGFW